MAIPENLKGRFAYHFTLIDNLESIIDNGLLCTNIKNARNINHKNVAEEGIQDRRSTMRVTCSNSKYVHDYVPFYFSKKTSMQLGVINKKNIDQPHLIYLSVPIEIIEQRKDVVFTDASANTNNPPNFYSASESQQLNTLNWDAIDYKKWGCPDETFRHQKMAELLIPEAINISDVEKIIVWNKNIHDKVVEIFKRKRVKAPQIIYSDNEHYYINFYEGGTRSIVTGPYFLNYLSKKTIEEITDSTNTPTKYPNLRSALTAIKANFNSIQELSDIVGLKANYGPHKDDVDIHTKKVAGNVVRYSEYANLDQKNKDILEISAYLHDIGKGPKSRWASNKMEKADNDHARKSLPMLKRILTEDIANLDPDSVRKIVTLVTYDDLIGDIVARGRNKQQLFDIITCEDDVNMLIALGRADMQSINPLWIVEHNRQIKTLKEEAIAYLGNN